MDSEPKLIFDIQKGDVLAFKFFFESLYPSMCLYANKFLNDDEASHDIVQDAFIYLWKRKGEMKSIPSARYYLLKYVKNRSLNYLRNVRKKDPLDLVRFEAESFLGDTVIENETYLLIDNAIHGLSPQSQRVIEMTLDGLRIREIARNLGVSLNTVKTIKLRAFESLRNKLKNKIITLFLIFTR